MLAEEAVKPLCPEDIRNKYPKRQSVLTWADKDLDIEFPLQKAGTTYERMLLECQLEGQFHRRWLGVVQT